MRRFALLLLPLLFVYAQAQAAETARERAVLAVADQFAHSVSQRDLDALMYLMDANDDVVVFGLAADARGVGPLAISGHFRRMFLHADELVMRYEWRKVSWAGPVALFAADVVLTREFDGERSEHMGRLTLVLQELGGAWLIRQGHLSFGRDDEV